MRPSLRPPLALAAAAGAVAAGGGLAVLGAGQDGSAGASSPAAAAATAPVTGCAASRAATQVRRGPSAGPRRVALTFDDGPASLTASFLRVLERERVPATFFVVGRDVRGREAVLRRVLADGSMLGNHSYSHVSLGPGDAAARRELARTQAAVRAATGFFPCLFRPPYGFSSRRLVAAARDQGLTSVLWSVNPQDFLRPGSARIRARVLAGVRPGAIVLGHDGGGDRRQTLAALPGIIHALRRRGYRFVTVTDLLGLAVVRR